MPQSIDLTGRKIIVIEHMEPFMSRWILEEYKEAMNIASKSGLTMSITGVRDPVAEALLKRNNIPYTSIHSWEVCDRPGAIVLDLWADRDLKTWEASNASCFIIGGIMGDNPPRGRGVILRSMFDWASIRRLGPLQLSVDTTVRVISKILEGYEITDIKMSNSVRLIVKTPLGDVEVSLPFAYILDERGNPLVSKGITELLSRGIMWDEETLLTY